MAAREIDVKEYFDGRHTQRRGPENVKIPRKLLSRLTRAPEVRETRGAAQGVGPGSAGTFEAGPDLTVAAAGVGLATLPFALDLSFL